MPLGNEPQPPLAAGASRRGRGRRAAVFPPYSSSLTCEKPHNCLEPTPYLLRNGVNNTWALRSQVWESPPPGPGQLPHFPILQVCASPTHLPGLSRHRAEPVGSAQPIRCCGTATSTLHRPAAQCGGAEPGIPVVTVAQRLSGTEKQVDEVRRFDAWRQGPVGFSDTCPGTNPTVGHQTEAPSPTSDSHATPLPAGAAPPPAVSPHCRPVRRPMRCPPSLQQQPPDNTDSSSLQDGHWKPCS